jgi:hypothetical protein
MGILLIGLAVLVAATLLFWTKIKTALNYRPVPGTVGGAIDVASGYVVDATADAALQSLVVLAWTHGDTQTIVLIDQVRKAIQSWNSPPAVVAPPVDPAVAALQSQVAMLVQAAASKSTTTIPAASVWVAPHVPAAMSEHPIP